MKLKKLFICLISMLFITLYGSIVCAYDVTYNDNTYTLNDEISNFKCIATVQLNNYIYILCADKPFVFFPNGTDSSGNTFWYIGYPDVDSGDEFYYKSIWWSDVSKIPSYTLSDFNKTRACFSSFTIPKNWTEENHATASFDLKDKDGNVIFKGPEPEFKNPEIQNKDKISNLDFDSMAIFLNDYDSKQRLYLHRLEVATTVDLGDSTVYYYNDKVFGLDFFTSYYNNDPEHPGYTIPKYQLELENNKIYYFLLSSSATSLDHSYNLIDYTKIENAYDGLGISTSDSFTYEQLQQEQQKKQNDQLEENNKTNKNIFETIKEMLSYLNPFSDNFILLKLWDFLGTLISYINPFSDNFLGKKIVELIGNLLKSLFVPSDEYFNNFFSDLKQWFSDRFGLLFYPFELIIDILNRITNINLSDPKFNIPEIKEPSTGKILFKAQNYNFNDLLNTNEFKIMHDIYFIIVDAIIIFALANLIKSKLKEVETE